MPLCLQSLPLKTHPVLILPADSPPACRAFPCVLPALLPTKICKSLWKLIRGLAFLPLEPDMKETFCLPFPHGPSRAVQQSSPQCPSGLVQSHLKGWERWGCSMNDLQHLLVTAGSRSRGPGPQHRRCYIAIHCLAILGERKDALHSAAPSLTRANLH